MAMTKLNVSFTTPYTVALDQTVTDSQIIDGTDFKMTDQNGDSVLSSYAVPSNVYYTSAQSAVNQYGTGVAESSDVETSSTGTTNSGEVLAPKFKTAGSYYQAIKVNIGTSTRTKEFMDSVIAHPELNAFTINGVNFADINTDNFKYDSANGTITFARKIIVSNDASQWTVSSVKGQVHAAKVVTLANDENKTIKNRALGANSDWLTDKVRTNQNGVKQYRVATGEWADANDVKFSENGSTSTDNSSALTDIQSVKGTVSLAKGNYVYMLFSKDGNQVKGRQLAGGTDWAYINTAKDSEGNTYYRVATNEWLIAGNGVTIK